MTSVGGVVGQPFGDAYCASKFAVEGLMQSLAPVAARFGVQVCLVEPGAVATEFVRNTGIQDGAGGTRGNEVGDADPYAPLLSAYLRRGATAFASAQSPIDAAAVVVEAATTSTPKMRWQTSAGATAFVNLSLRDLDGTHVLTETSTWLD